MARATVRRIGNKVCCTLHNGQFYMCEEEEAIERGWWQEGYPKGCVQEIDISDKLATKILFVEHL